MPLFNLDSFKAQLSGGGTAAQEKEVFRDLLISVLSRGSRADLHTDSEEIALIQKLVAEHTGEELDAGSIRATAIMASSDNSMRSVAKLASKLPENYRILVIDALRAVILADDRVSHREIDFFNSVAGALRLSYADVAGLLEEDE